mmetsp:Transcript_43923/g.91664  ORF Transcript_43923/g.91664 Transcript_43923/m.91664 type:complete len:153 (+) Transcript_43923:229-687(+)
MQIGNNSKKARYDMDFILSCKDALNLTSVGLAMCATHHANMHGQIPSQRKDAGSPAALLCIERPNCSEAAQGRRYSLSSPSLGSGSSCAKALAQSERPWSEALSEQSAGSRAPTLPSISEETLSAAPFVSAACATNTAPVVASFTLVTQRLL